MSGNQYGQSVTYACAKGFSAYPGEEFLVRQCDEKGQWAGVEPRCLGRSLYPSLLLQQEHYRLLPWAPSIFLTSVLAVLEGVGVGAVYGF